MVTVFIRKLVVEYPVEGFIRAASQGIFPGSPFLIQIAGRTTGQVGWLISSRKWVRFPPLLSSRLDTARFAGIRCDYMETFFLILFVAIAGGLLMRGNVFKARVAEARKEATFHSDRAVEWHNRTVDAGKALSEVQEKIGQRDVALAENNTAIEGLKGELESARANLDRQTTLASGMEGKYGAELQKVNKLAEQFYKAERDIARLSDEKAELQKELDNAKARINKKKKRH
jgi:hypothetical protein